VSDGGLRSGLGIFVFSFFIQEVQANCFSSRRIFRASEEDMPLGEYKLSQALINRLDYFGLQNLGPALVHRDIRSVKILFCLPDDEKKALFFD
jgi:hypothetical protein